MGWTAPKTWVVGEPSVVGDLNTYIRDNLNYLYGDPSPITLPLAAGWVEIGGGYAPLTLRRVGPLVMVDGTVKATVAQAAQSVLAALPAGYIPAYQQILTASTTPGPDRVDVTAAASVPASSLWVIPAVALNGFVALTGIYSLI